MNPRRIVLGLLAVLVASLALSGPVAAHAQYVSSDPVANSILATAPGQVSVTLSETIQPGTGGIAVTNTSGTRFDQPNVTYSADRRTMSVSLAANGPGVYSVTWSAVSALDGHATAGGFSYVVQNPDGSLPGPLPTGGPTSSGSPVSPFEVGLRFIGFFGLAVVLGIGVMATFMWIPAGRDPDVQALRAYGVGFPVLLNVGRIAAFAFAGSMAGLFVLATGLDESGIGQALSQSPYLQSVAARLALGALLFVLLSRAFGRSRVEAPEKSARTIQVSVLLALAAIGAGSVGTHAAAAPVGPGPLVVGWFVVSAATLQFLIPALAVLSDAGHLVGVGLWVGGLAGIVAVRSLFRESEAAPLARIVLGRFSRLAAYGVAMILGGGVILALLLVGSWETLLETPYGWVVLGKIALFAPMVSLGAFNRFRLIPKTVEEPVATDAVRRLVSNVRFETALGIAVLLLAGLLTSMQTAAVAAGPMPFALDAPADDLRVHLLVDPYPSAPGIYVFTTTLFDAVTGAPFDAEAHNTTGRITLTLLDSTLPPSTANLSGPHYPNHFFQTVTLSRRGVWRADVTFSRIDAFDVRATFHVPLDGGG
ncbi:MAG: hypothetical protein E6K19_06655 [Methanobacteriota archaeon]|nr:MAG: hypothetical protein E6K19_06655 [Euryarchaeota archaeon]